MMVNYAPGYAADHQNKNAGKACWDITRAHFLWVYPAFLLNVEQVRRNSS